MISFKQTILFCNIQDCTKLFFSSDMLKQCKNGIWSGFKKIRSAEDKKKMVRAILKLVEHMKVPQPITQPDTAFCHLFRIFEGIDVSLGDLQAKKLNLTTIFSYVLYQFIYQYSSVGQNHRTLDTSDNTHFQVHSIIYVSKKMRICVIYLWINPHKKAFEILLTYYTMFSQTAIAYILCKLCHLNIKEIHS